MKFNNDDFLKTLTTRERYIIEHWPDMTLKQIGEQFNVSGSRIGQQKKKALRKIEKQILLMAGCDE